MSRSKLLYNPIHMCAKSKPDRKTASLDLVINSLNVIQAKTNLPSHQDSCRKIHSENHAAEVQREREERLWVGVEKLPPDIICSQMDNKKENVSYIGK